MSTTAISIRAEKLDEVGRMLNGIKNGVRDAMVGAINETSKEQRTAISRDIRERVLIKKKDVDKHIHIGHAAKTKLSSYIRLDATQRLSLKYFGARQFGGRRIKKKDFGIHARMQQLHERLIETNRGGVKYKISKQGGQKTVRSAFMGPKPGAIATRLGGHVFKRQGKKRLPIRKLMGPSAYGVFKKSGLEAPTVIKTEEVLEKNLSQRVNFLILKAEGKI